MEKDYDSANHPNITSILSIFLTNKGCIDYSKVDVCLDFGVAIKRRLGNS